MKNPFLRILFVVTILVGFYVILYNSHAHQLQQQKLSADFLHHPILITGKISSIPHWTLSSTSFDFAVSQVSTTPKKLQVHLNWYGKRPALWGGDTWQLWVKLRDSSEIPLKNNFNYGAFLQHQGLMAVGYVLKNTQNKRLKFSPRFSLLNIRQQLAHKLFKLTPDQHAAAIIIALTLGSTAYLSSNDRALFENTGTSYLIVVAGLHIGLLAAMIYWVVKNGWKCSEKLLLFMPAQRAALLGAILFSILYAAMAGFGIPTQRALIMLLLMMAAEWWYYQISLGRRLLLAFILILLVEPFALYSAGFWLSFAAVGCIACVMCTPLRSNKVMLWLKIQTAIGIGLTPLTLYFFQQQALSLWITNVFAAPWVCFVIMPLALIACLCCSWCAPMAKIILWCAVKLLWPVLQWLQFFANRPYFIWHHAMDSLLQVVLASAGAALLLAARPWWLRGVGLLVMVGNFLK